MLKEVSDIVVTDTSQPHPVGKHSVKLELRENASSVKASQSKNYVSNKRMEFWFREFS